MLRFLCIGIIICLIMPCYGLAVDKNIKTITGEVVVLEPKDRAILVKKVVGKHEYINGGVIDEHTEIVVAGKKASIEDIKVKDRVTLIMIIKDEDVYVKKIIKK